MLKWNKSLKEINLLKNNIETEGAKYLAEALISNTSLEYIYLSENNFGDNGSHFFAEAFKRNKSLKDVYLKGSMNEEAAILVQQAWELNRRRAGRSIV